MTSPVADETEFTELRDADVPRVDLVSAAANGVPGFLVMKQADGAGLLDPEFVRDLVAKADPGPPREDAVTMTGSPAAIAKLIHAAAKRAEEPVEKADLSTADLNDLPDSAFAYIEPGGTKDEHGRTVPRSKRHFAIHDAAHVRNALSRAPQSEFGDKAMPKIRAAAKRFDIDVSKEVGVADDMDGMDPTVALADPDGDSMPGSDMDPGSPAWEQVDAATAQKWTSILARAKSAICMLAEREMLEAAAGDADDGMKAMDLEDACCAIDYAIGVLAPFAVSEQASAEAGADEMQGIGKALAGFDAGQLDTVEALAAVKKAGRVLSASNEAAIRGAVDALQKVLASLPEAPAVVEKVAAANPTQPSADAKEHEMPTTESSAEAVARAGGVPTMGTAKPTAPAAGPEFPVAKADGEKTPMAVVYDQKGRLIGIVDPTDITPVANSEAEPDGDGADGADGADGTDGMDGADGAATQTPDLTPAPAGQVGTPADAVADGVTKETTDITSDAVLKGIAADVVKAQLDEYSATQQQVIAKQAETIAAMAETVEVLKGRIATLEEQPAVPKVFTNGAVPPAPVLRGQDQGRHAAVDTASAMVRKQALYTADATEQKRIAEEMQGEAIARLQEIHHRRA